MGLAFCSIKIIFNVWIMELLIVYHWYGSICMCHLSLTRIISSIIIAIDFIRFKLNRIHFFGPNRIEFHLIRS
ncbi:hypothetical protein L1987_78735 [Smallanthus sonchifolius]|uniref:Uncharacterized protein n=1 Tax=Smallanthus sonchifolius TaxID=185202 RepID=A0ACB8ZDH4_9ASTR|nr:hypothetical protein L1987_78735 [Smallanthus sonchifolius]